MTFCVEMPMTCASCKLVYQAGLGLSFHRFPNEDQAEELRTWINFCGKANINVKQARLCAARFRDEDFDCSGTSRKLKAQAVPTRKVLSAKT